MLNLALYWPEQVPIPALLRYEARIEPDDVCPLGEAVISAKGRRYNVPLNTVLPCPLTEDRLRINLHRKPGRA